LRRETSDVIRRTLIAISCLLVLLAPEAWAEKPKVRATIEELFRDAMYRRAVVSPGGRYVAAEFSTGARRKVVIVDAEQNIREDVLTIYEDLPDARISQVFWADTDSLLITVDKPRQKFGTRRESVTYVVDVSPGQEDLGRQFYEIEVRGSVIDPLSAIDDKILYAPTGDSSSVYQLTLSELPSYVVEAPKDDSEVAFTEDALVARLEDNVFDWISDARGNVRAAVAVAEDPLELRIWYRSGVDAEWRIVLAESDPERVSEIIPLGISEDGNKLLVATDRDRDRYGLYEYDPDAEELGELIYEHPTAQLTGVIYDYSRSQLLGTTYLDAGEVHYAYLESGDQRQREILKRAFPDRSVATTSISSDRRRLSVLAASPHDPGIFYHFDLDSGRATQIGKVAPWLDNNALGEVRAFKVRSSDEIEIDAFLTRPPLFEGRPPLVVMPHGGPVGVMDLRTFDPVVQYLARSNFAVLQVNYRGSGGYGRAFREAGYRQWGRGIENDIDAAVEYVMEQGWVDTDRMCVVGASYGGYSALMSLVRHPTRYRCAATYAGVTDIALMFNSSDWASSEATRTVATELFGDPDDEYEELREHSPVYHADKIGVPIFLAHGAQDRRVDVDHAYRMKAMLELHDIPLRWELMEDYGHGFPSTEDEKNYYVDLREFLAEHLRD